MGGASVAAGRSLGNLDDSSIKELQDVLDEADEHTRDVSDDRMFNEIMLDEIKRSCSGIRHPAAYAMCHTKARYNRKRSNNDARLKTRDTANNLLEKLLREMDSR